MDRERFSGCLIGQCLGDALGFPVEGLPPDLVPALTDRGTGYDELVALAHECHARKHGSPERARESRTEVLSWCGSSRT